MAKMPEYDAAQVRAVGSLLRTPGTGAPSAEQPLRTWTSKDAPFGVGFTIPLEDVRPELIEILFRACPGCWGWLSECTCHERGYN